jgi:hypothetical protein
MTREQSIAKAYRRHVREIHRAGPAAVLKRAACGSVEGSPLTIMVLAATPEDERDFFHAGVTCKVLPAAGDPPSTAGWSNMTNHESVLRDA